MGDICISYRRADSQAITGRIFDRLIAHYGHGSVFMDIDNIPAGIDFRQYLNKTLQKATVLLAIVGPKWLGAGKGGPDRIHDESDPVRVELETALRNGLAIIPVLIGNRKMPGAAQVPSSLKDFVFINAVTVDPGVDFDHHMQRLIFHIDAIFAAKGKAAVRAPARETVPARPTSAAPRPNRWPTQAAPSQAVAERSERRTPSADPETFRRNERSEQTSGGQSSKGLLSWLPPGLRIPFVAGTAVVGLGLLALAFLLLNGPDKVAAPLAPGAQAETSKRGGGKCSVEGFSLDLRNCR